MENNNNHDDRNGQDTQVYAAAAMVDLQQPEITEYIKENLRHKLMEKLGPVLFDGEKHVFQIQEETVPCIQGVQRVTYRAFIRTVEVREYIDLQEKPCHTKKGRNHRKKERAAARRRRALRKRLREGAGNE